MPIMWRTDVNLIPTRVHPRGTGYARKFSNVMESDESSLGFFYAEEIYLGEHGLSLRMDGLSKTNSHVREREIVIHGADYVNRTIIFKAAASGVLPSLSMSATKSSISWVAEL